MASCLPICNSKHQRESIKSYRCLADWCRCGKVTFVFRRERKCSHRLKPAARILELVPQFCNLPLQLLLARRHQPGIDEYSNKNDGADGIQKIPVVHCASTTLSS